MLISTKCAMYDPLTAFIILVCSVYGSHGFQCYECSGTATECLIGGDPAVLVRSCLASATQPRCTVSYSAGQLTQRACYNLKAGDEAGCKTNSDSTVCICENEECNSPQNYGPTYGDIDPAQARLLLAGVAPKENPVAGSGKSDLTTVPSTNTTQSGSGSVIHHSFLRALWVTAACIVAEIGFLRFL